MNTILLYVIVAMPLAPSIPPKPNSIYAVHQTRDQQRCEALEAQLNKAPSNGNRYECRTMVRLVGGAT